MPRMTQCMMTFVVLPHPKKTYAYIEVTKQTCMFLQTEYMRGDTVSKAFEGGYNPSAVASVDQEWCPGFNRMYH